jgi:hypothetical protein
MSKTVFTILLVIIYNCAFAQYIHYSDKRSVYPAAPAEAPPKTPQAEPKIQPKDTIKIIVRDTVKQFVRDTIRIIIRDTIVIRDTVVVRDTIRLGPNKVVYHQWPDKCPGLSGAVPVLLNYIPKEMVLKLTEIFEGHLYSISSIKLAVNKIGYKLKVCEGGQIKYEYADEDGNIVTKQMPVRN